MEGGLSEDEDDCDGEGTATVIGRGIGAGEVGGEGWRDKGVGEGLFESGIVAKVIARLLLRVGSEEGTEGLRDSLDSCTGYGKGQLRALVYSDGVRNKSDLFSIQRATIGAERPQGRLETAHRQIQKSGTSVGI